MDLDFFAKIIYEIMIIFNRCKLVHKYLFWKAC